MKNIFVLDEGAELKNKIVEIFKKEKGNKIKQITCKDFQKSLNEIPDLYLINED